MDMNVGEAGWRDEAFGESQKGKMHVFFYETQVKDNFQSQAQGRPIFRTQVRIKKLVPGDPYNQPDRPMRETDKEEYPEAWLRYQQKAQNKVPGTPLEAWGILTDTQVAEFKALNIFTIDQFAQLPDSAGNKIMGFNDLRAKAKAFVLHSKDTEAAAKLQSELEKRDREIEEMKAQLAELTAAKSAEKSTLGLPKKG